VGCRCDRDGAALCILLLPMELQTIIMSNLIPGIKILVMPLAGM